MRKLYLVITILFISLTNLRAQYTVQSPYLTNPDKNIDFVDSCAQFWLNAYDDTYGGFHVEIGREGNVLNYNYKGLVGQSRNAYGFARAYMLTGNSEYLTMAESALGFMYDHLYDQTNGGWYAGSDRAGNPWTGNDKVAFDQHYALLGISAYYEATRNENDGDMLINGYNFNINFLYDNREDYVGYYNTVQENGANPTNKSFNATVDAITTHLYGLYLMTQDEQYLVKLLDMKDNIIDRLINSMNSTGNVIGFAEWYDSDWNINFSADNSERTIMGHVLKSAWSLGRIYRIVPDEYLLDAADTLIQDVLQKGYDHELGGPYKDYSRLTGEMYMYGANDTAKAWWQMEQAVTSGLVLYDLTGDDTYLQMADESLDFFMKYFVDHEYGEVYADRSRTGGRVYYNGGYWDENKGSNWKAAYHSIETGYYAYLYGKLILQQQPTSLYYNFAPADYEREIILTPLAVDFSQLQIQSVMHADSNFLAFNSNTRVLTLPANVEGEFIVTYTMQPVGIAENSPTIKEDKFELSGNYPNPFNPVTSIKYHLGKPTMVKLTMFNSLGQKIEVLEEKYKSIGSHTVTWNAGNLPSGIYYYTLQAGSNIKTGKCMLIK